MALPRLRSQNISHEVLTPWRPGRRHSILLAVVNAITASEFRGSGPPVQRGANLAQLIHRGRLAAPALPSGWKLPLGGVLT